MRPCLVLYYTYDMYTICILVICRRVSMGPVQFFCICGEIFHTVNSPIQTRRRLCFITYRNQVFCLFLFEHDPSVSQESDLIQDVIDKETGQGGTLHGIGTLA